MTIIQIYVPINGRTDTETVEFYKWFDEAMLLTKKGELTMVLGDFTAKIYSEAERTAVGKLALESEMHEGINLSSSAMRTIDELQTPTLNYILDT